MLCCAAALWRFGETGYADIRTPDPVVHGQVKQTGNFAFVHVFGSRDTVLFFQPALDLEILRRTINAKDIATGTEDVDDYITEDLLRSTYREGSGTVQWTLVPENATYNVWTNKPNSWNIQVLLIPEHLQN
jgi:hypothetical protein